MIVKGTIRNTKVFHYEQFAIYGICMEVLLCTAI